MTKIAHSQYKHIVGQYEAGTKVQEIAESYAASAHCIYSILRSLPTAPIKPKKGLGADGSYRRLVPVSAHSAIVAAYKAGATLQEIASEYGVSRERIRQILTAIGIDSGEGGQAIKTLLGVDSKAAARRQHLQAREARISAKWGMSLEMYQQHVAEFGNSTTKSSPLGRYIEQRKNAQRRGLGWDFTFATWWQIWVDSGKWGQRQRGGYVMARYGDGKTAYSPENVYICTASQNSKDSFIVSPAPQRAALAKARKALANHDLFGVAA